MSSDPRMPVDQAASLFGLLSDETRLRMLLALANGNGGVHVGGLAEALSVSQTAVSQHLQRLRLSGVVTHRREGRNVFYALAQGLARDLLLRHVRP